MKPSARALAGLLALALAPVTAPAATATRTGTKSSALPVPALIERAVRAGELDPLTADRYLIEALRGGDLPEAYRSATPYDGTLPLLELRERMRTLPRGEHRAYLRHELHPGPVGTDQCGLPPTSSTVVMPNTIESPHFYIEYNAVTLGGGLTINDYVAALEGSWTREVDEFGWAPPPPYTPNPAPNGKYPVRIDTLGLGLYGFVSNGGTHAGRVGNNPATPWNEGDADASCMVMNANYDPFPGTPTQALQATAAHEFNHSIQFGWGVLDRGRNMPDGVFVEGGATWMEDEVFDDANDSYNYLWPVFEDDMGQYEGRPTTSPYDYWVTWRGITEPYGTGVPGGGEDIFQRFWTLTSRGDAHNLEALDQALAQVGDSSLPAAFHAYAIAVKFSKPCGGGYVPPYCLEEGPGYTGAKGDTPLHGSVAMDQALQGSIPDNYAINWIALPAATSFQAVLRNASGGGRFRASIACDTGTSLVVVPFSSVVDAGESAVVRAYDGASCAAPVAVVTNVTQTDANPSSSAPRPYSLAVLRPPAPSTLSVRGRAARNSVVARGTLVPPGAGSQVEVTLLARRRGWKPVASRQIATSTGGRFRARFPRPASARCRIEARFAGTAEYLPSSAQRTFRC